MAIHVGQYVVPRFVKIPAPVAGAPGANGITLDAGAAIVLDSNTSWLCRESCRQITAKPGPGSITVFTDSSKLFTDNASLLGPPRADSAPTTVGEIPWDRRTAVRIGPIQLVSDEENDGGQLVPRKIRFSIDVSKSVGVTLDLYVAITRTESTRMLMLGEYLAFGNEPAVTTGIWPIDITPEVPVPASAWQSWRNQANTSAVSPMSLVCAAWLWVGFRAIGAGTASINGYSILETR
jgi:hypothetical protein